jgi:hypothetical protein
MQVADRGAPEVDCIDAAALPAFDREEGADIGGGGGERVQVTGLAPGRDA